MWFHLRILQGLGKAREIFMPVWHWFALPGQVLFFSSFFILPLLSPLDGPASAWGKNLSTRENSVLPGPSEVVALDIPFIPPQPTRRSTIPYFAEKTITEGRAIDEEVFEFPIHKNGSSRNQLQLFEEEGVPLLSETVVEGSRFIQRNEGIGERWGRDEFPGATLAENGVSEQIVVNQVSAQTSPEVAVEAPFVDPFETSTGDQMTEESRDPWESFNSSMFDFNYKVDRYVMKPVAKGYNFFIPPDVQGSLGNAFSNMAFAPRFLNNIFQGKFSGAGIETQRFLINTIMGVGGFFDVAKYVFDIEAPAVEDVGQSLAVRGVGSGPYLVLPFLPPTTVRDFAGFIGDTFLNPLNYVIPFFPNLGANVGQRINERSINLETFEGIEDSTVDLYGAVRSAYFDRRQRQILE